MRQINAIYGVGDDISCSGSPWSVISHQSTHLIFRSSPTIVMVVKVVSSLDEFKTIVCLVFLASVRGREVLKCPPV